MSDRFWNGAYVSGDKHFSHVSGKTKRVTDERVKGVELTYPLAFAKCFREEINLHL
jgi:hypothetical protein